MCALLYGFRPAKDRSMWWIWTLWSRCTWSGSQTCLESSRSMLSNATTHQQSWGHWTLWELALTVPARYWQIFYRKINSLFTCQHFFTVCSPEACFLTRLRLVRFWPSEWSLKTSFMLTQPNRSHTLNMPALMELIWWLLMMRMNYAKFPFITPKPSKWNNFLFLNFAP